MQEYIGVRSWFDTSLYPSLKRDALMFNRVAIPDYDRLIPWLSKRTRIGTLLPSTKRLRHISTASNLFRSFVIAHWRVHSEPAQSP